ncbi:MAG TPA: hypothetical protein GXX72_07910 [Clostridiaceae bacterium]|nr:hypothetical protein [Clostridiaceae bacterium]
MMLQVWRYAFRATTNKKNLIVSVPFFKQLPNDAIGHCGAVRTLPGMKAERQSKGITVNILFLFFQQVV